MILVILGTQDKTFPRLLEAIQKQIDLGNISKEEKIVVQSGSTAFESNDMIVKDYIPVKEFEQLIDEADLVITHAGVGTILTALQKEKKIIAAARLRKYGEHVNDHQVQILDTFEKAGYVIGLRNFDELNLIIEKAKDFKPAKFKSNQEVFVKMLEQEINK